MRIERKLDEWKQEGLIDAAAAERIKAFEASRVGSQRWVVWAFAAVGGLAVVCGIISLIAANWEDIPDAVKLGMGLSMLVGTAIAAMKADGWIRDLLLLIHQGLVIAMIGLVAQVYHLSGHPYRPFVVAGLFAIPAAFAGRRALLFDVPLYYMMQALWLFLDEARLLDPLFGGFRAPGLLVFIACALICLDQIPSIARPALRRWAFALSAIAIITSAVSWSTKTDWYPWSGFDWPLMLALVGMAAAGYATFRRQVDPAVLAASVLGAVMILSAPHTPDWSHTLKQAIGFAFFCSFAVAFTIASANSGSRFGVNVGSFALGVRILILFFELFKDLTDTGVGLIITGLLLVGIAYTWWRVRVLIPVKVKP